MKKYAGGGGGGVGALFRFALSANPLKELLRTGSVPTYTGYVFLRWGIRGIRELRELGSGSPMECCGRPRQGRVFYVRVRIINKTNVSNK